MKLTKCSLISFIKKAIFLVKIEGESAWPELVSGKIYFATNLVKLKVGNFIIFQNPKNREEILVKKIKLIEENTYFVEGTLPWAESSRNFGSIDRCSIFGKILFI